MGEMDISRVLGEMRALQARSALPKPAVAATPGGGDVKPADGFVDALSQAARQVSDSQMQSVRATEDFQLGRGDLASTMLKVQEAGLQFRAAVEVRNRMVAAYQDIMNMPL